MIRDGHPGEDETSQGSEGSTVSSSGYSSASAFNIISKALLQLSLKDRNDIQEEIHSVYSMEREESPWMLEESLRKFAVELDHKIPQGKKRAYLRCQEICSSATHLPAEDPFPGQSQSPRDGTRPITPITPCYINSDDFRLRFLRSQFFDIPKAARQLCGFLDNVLEHFGEVSLTRPIRLETDFSKEEMKAMKKGFIQLLPYRDRLGRRILIFFPGSDFSEIPISTKVSGRNLAIVCPVLHMDNFHRYRRGYVYNFTHTYILIKTNILYRGLLLLTLPSSLLCALDKNNFVYVYCCYR